MDTGTHIVMGIALGGLALADPVVASIHSQLLQLLQVQLSVLKHLI